MGRNAHRVHVLLLIGFALICSGVSAEPTRVRELPAIDELVGLSDEELDKLDLAVTNLACAVELPGSEIIDATAMCAKLDVWAAHVGLETQKYAYDFYRRPAYFKDSFGQFCMEMLVTVLQQDFDVRYHPLRIRNVDFTRSEDLFLHGLLDGKGGTCCSMPVLYVAIGRRLGYPLKLVTSPEHLYLRWDDPKTGERFNVDGTTRGFVSKPDAYYARWPRPVTAAERRYGNYFTSLTPRQELAEFLTTRAHALFDLGELERAKKTYETALRLSPRSVSAQLWYHRARLAIEKAGNHKRKRGSKASTEPPSDTNSDMKTENDGEPR